MARRDSIPPLRGLAPSYLAGISPPIIPYPPNSGGCLAMPIEKNLRRLPLRDLLTDAEKRNRDLIEHLHNTWLARASDLRDLSRPVRRRSHYPTLVALLNAIQKLLELTEETEALLVNLGHRLGEIHEHARRERLNRR